MTKGREVTFAERVVGAQSIVHNGELDFTLTPGRPVYLVVPILSDLDAPDHQAAAQRQAQAMTPSSIIEVRDAHREWWRKYWSQSFVAIDDPILEKYYYASRYITASASRSGKVAPGLYGPWVTTDHPSWNGDYTLDYNYQPPPLGLYSSNHISITDSYEPPILDFMVRGKACENDAQCSRRLLPWPHRPVGTRTAFRLRPIHGNEGQRRLRCHANADALLQHL